MLSVRSSGRKRFLPRALRGVGLIAALSKRKDWQLALFADGSHSVVRGAPTRAEPRPILTLVLTLAPTPRKGCALAARISAEGTDLSQNVSRGRAVLGPFNGVHVVMVFVCQSLCISALTQV